MAWYWVVLIIVGYFIMGTLTAFIFLFFGEDDEDELMLFAALWPLLLSFLIVTAPFALFYWIVNKLKEGIKQWRYDN